MYNFKLQARLSGAANDSSTVHISYTSTGSACSSPFIHSFIFIPRLTSSPQSCMPVPRSTVRRRQWHWHWHWFESLNCNLPVTSHIMISMMHRDPGWHWHAITLGLCIASKVQVGSPSRPLGPLPTRLDLLGTRSSSPRGPGVALATFGSAQWDRTRGRGTAVTAAEA